MTTADKQETDTKRQLQALTVQMHEALTLLDDFPPKLKGSQTYAFNQVRWILWANFNEIRTGNLDQVQSLNGALQKLHGITK